jgi:hypothetical protein
VRQSSSLRYLAEVNQREQRTHFIIQLLDAIPAILKEGANTWRKQSIT